MEGHLLAKTWLHTDIDVSDTVAKSMAHPGNMHRTSWLQASEVPKKYKPQERICPLKEQHYSEHMEDALHSFQDSSALRHQPQSVNRLGTRAV